jgi:hypothetical protein
MVTIQFNNGNPFSVDAAGVHSANRTLPNGVSSVTVQILDPLGEWVDPANAGGTFIFGVEFSLDGGTNWQVLSSNGTGQAVGSLFKGHLPMVGLVGDDLAVAHGMPCRAFASSTNTITIAAQAIIT